MIYETHHKKLKVEQHEPTKTGSSGGAQCFTFTVIFVSVGVMSVYILSEVKSSTCIYTLCTHGRLNGIIGPGKAVNW